MRYALASPNVPFVFDEVQFAIDPLILLLNGLLWNSKKREARARGAAEVKGVRIVQGANFFHPLVLALCLVRVQLKTSRPQLLADARLGC